jgi:acyl transferase domain-containing protein/acyl carrier protein
MGPGRSLATLVRQHPRCRPDQVVLSSMRHRHERVADAAVLLNALGRLWLVGTPIDWPAVHAPERARRVSLPTYPFERQRFWIDPVRRMTRSEPPAAAAAVATPSLTRATNPAEWLYVPGWRRTAPPVSAERPSPGTCWLVFSDDSGVGLTLGRRLERDGNAVVYVGIGEQFDRRGDGRYSLDPTRREDYVALLTDLRSRGRRPAAVLHLWSVATADRGPLDRETFTRAQERGFYSLLWLVQAYGSERLALPQRMVVVSSGVQDITGEERLSPGRATVLAMCTVIPQEHPGTTCRSIDITAPPPGARPDDELADRLFADVTGDAGDRVIGYRHRHRWVQTFEPFRGGPDGAARLREGGVYLITGGLGRIGMVLAEHLARTARARLVLVSRTRLPSAPARSHASEGSDRGWIQHRLRALEVHGAEVVVAGADVQRRDQMQAVVDDTMRRFGAIHGVIHAAGVTVDDGFGAVESIEYAACERQFGPKVYGSLVLAEVLRSCAPDFVLLCSSLSSVLGGLGFVAYAGANLFLDAFARHHGRQAAWGSVNWEGWRFGERANVDAEAGRGIDLALSPEEGGRVFRRILCVPPLAQVLVSTASLPARVARWAGAESSAAEDRTPPSPTILLHSRPALATPRVAPRTEPERLLARIWEETLGIEQIGVEDDFFELGGDSLMAIQLMARVCTGCKVKIPLHRLFEAPTIADLATVVEDALLAELEALSDAEAKRFLTSDG